MELFSGKTGISHPCDAVVVLPPSAAAASPEESAGCPQRCYRGHPGDENAWKLKKETSIMVNDSFLVVDHGGS